MEKVNQIPLGPIASAIQDKIANHFKVMHLQLENESHMHSRNPKGETHFNLLLVSEDFKNKKLIERHRLVNNLIQTERDQGLHALTLRTLTPEEWAKDPQNLDSPACVSKKAKL